MSRYDRIYDYMATELDDDELVDAWNHYQVQCCYEDDIYPMCELGLMIGDMDRMEIVNAFAGNKDFDLSDDWFFIGIYGWYSFSVLDDRKSPFDLGDLVSYIDRVEDDCGIGWLEDLFHGLAGEDREDYDEE